MASISSDPLTLSSPKGQPFQDIDKALKLGLSRVWLSSEHGATLKGVMPPKAGKAWAPKGLPLLFSIEANLHCFFFRHCHLGPFKVPEDMDVWVEFRCDKVTHVMGLSEAES